MLGAVMPYSTILENKIEDIVHQWDSIEKKKMFGGICYLINGNMSFGAWKDCLIVRMGPDLAAEKLTHDHVRPFDITGKPMKGWLMVEKGSWNKRNELDGWLDVGRSFALSLPKKSPKRKSLEEIYYRSQK
jgi:TfoX/Sxy family transcriptional regulator of competence genes